MAKEGAACCVCFEATVKQPYRVNAILLPIYTSQYLDLTLGANWHGSEATEVPTVAGGDSIPMPSAASGCSACGLDEKRKRLARTEGDEVMRYLTYANLLYPV